MRKLVVVGCALAAGLAVAGGNFGKLSDGREPHVYTLQSENLRLDVTDYGGRLIRCYVPDRYGNLADVTLGWNTAAEY